MHTPECSQENNTSYILLIEDEAEIRDAVVLSFKGRGHCIVSASDGQAALEELRHHTSKPAVIVSDYWLGKGENGLEVIEAVRTMLRESVPGVLLSGDTSPETLKHLSESGVVVLHKPVRYTELWKTIEDLGVAL